MTDNEYSLSMPELCSPSHLYNRSDTSEAARSGGRIALQIADPEHAPDLVELQEMDPETYRMVVYSWA